MYFKRHPKFSVVPFYNNNNRLFKGNNALLKLPNQKNSSKIGIQGNN